MCAVRARENVEIKDKKSTILRIPVASGFLPVSSEMETVKIHRAKLTGRKSRVSSLDTLAKFHIPRELAC